MPIKNQTYIEYIGLVDSAAPNHFKVSPTIAEEDFRVSIDRGRDANIY